MSLPLRPAIALAGLLVLMIASALLAMSVGAVRLPPARLFAILAGGAADARESVVLWQIRAPRAALAIVVGMGLGVAGAAQQGLFRNPLADPALIGVSAGAALAAVAAIVLGGALAIPFLVPSAAFAGGLAASVLAFRLARTGAADTGGLLLAGIAVNAMGAAGTGLLITMSNDRQLRDITFWTLGSLAAGTWTAVLAVTVMVALSLALLGPTARSLDALLLGEAEATYLGIDLPGLRRIVVTATALAVGAAVAVCGIIGFVGLVVPHLVRMLLGGRHATLLPGAGLLGATLLLLADAGARTLAAPAELPVGLLTALLGAPFFVTLLLRRGAPA